MPTTSTTDKKVYNALPITEKLEFTKGVSAKSGNEYLIGALYLKSPVSDTPIRLSFEYIDPNVRALIEMALEKSGAADIAAFSKDVQND